ncbi:2-amino-1-hydroxyethylphosphonate dioxygenase (glycine-forming)-like [Ylistrum balloti]|uniref:2-amino-1-hydroxyethylphosphonate dioxygenase (glycine-forming)-like n=1 Tax=Ylistrum balloti TaxID=509963 RepID=UPI002905B32A|nr:2-amino-1-hydroxyethylphosphonate dioxygenase (glycine-forming)-like [Ylistrum balloti]
MDVDDRVNAVFFLYERHGSGDYIGEPVSLVEHMTQCAILAEQDGQPAEVVLAAFFHDVGHLIGMEKGLEKMVTSGTNLGAKDHDVLGGQFLRELGFPDKVCNLVQGHVQAKRYLVWKNKEYYNNLSPASRLTLEHQGGRMSDEEARAFENNPLFDIILRMRTWDEKGKSVDVSNVHIDKYRKLCTEYLRNIQ